MYTELSDILRDNIHSLKSDSVVDFWSHSSINSSFQLKWVAGLFKSFKEDFFIRRDSNYQGLIELESDKYVGRECFLWLNTASSRLIELVPLFKLLCGAAFLRQRWTHDDETQIAFNLHFNQLFFAFGQLRSSTAISVFLQRPTLRWTMLRTLPQRVVIYSSAWSSGSAR